MRRGRQIFWSLVPAFAAAALCAYAAIGALLLMGRPSLDVGRLHGLTAHAALAAAAAGLSATIIP